MLGLYRRGRMGKEGFLKLAPSFSLFLSSFFPSGEDRERGFSVFMGLLAEGKILDFYSYPDISR
jgi:hypothetical protein